MKSPNFTKCSICLLCTSCFAIVMSIAMLAGGFDAIFNAILKKQLEMKEGGVTYEIWQELPVPVLFRVYFFNITNPSDYLNGSKPILNQMGPYSYRQYEVKENITFHNNDTLTYYVRRWWIWDEELSLGNSENDIITALNPIVVSSAFVNRKNPTLLSSLSYFMDEVGELPIVQVTAGELLFSGFQDPLLDITQAALNQTSENMTIPIDVGLLDYDKFAWFYTRNDSMYYDGIFNMYSGATTMDDVGRIDWWNYTRETEFYDAPCNVVEGSAGELFPPHPSKDFIKLYSTDMCVTLQLDYHKEKEDRFGINGYMYWGSNKTFTNESKCYCVEDRCAPAGMLNTETCKFGTPAFVSFPHFFNADPYLLDEVDGLLPEEEKHAFFLSIEPETGTPLEIAARIQINIQTTPYPGGRGGIGKVRMLENITELKLPLFWFEMLGALNEELADDIKPVIFIAASPTITIIFYVVLAIGLVVIGFVVYKATFSMAFV